MLFYLFFFFFKYDGALQMTLHKIIVGLLDEDIYCYSLSEFHASYEAIIRQLSKITYTREDIQNLKIQNNG